MEDLKRKRKILVKNLKLVDFKSITFKVEIRKGDGRGRLERTLERQRMSLFFVYSRTWRPSFDLEDGGLSQATLD